MCSTCATATGCIVSGGVPARDESVITAAQQSRRSTFRRRAEPTLRCVAVMRCSGMPLDPGFVADCPYGPGAILISDIVHLDTDAGEVHARLPVHEDLPLTRDQRAHPIFHPRHVNGGLMVHMTGILGFAHAYFVMGLRHSEGWIGYGGRIYSARYLSMATMDEPLTLELEETRRRQLGKQIYSRYNYRFRQGKRDVYRSDQVAVWMKIEE